MANLLTFMERQLARYELKGDKQRADKLRKIIREWKAMDTEQRTLSSRVFRPRWASPPIPLRLTPDR